MPQVLIHNARTGEEYQIDSSVFRRGRHYRDRESGELMTFEAGGFRIASLADGSPYEAPHERPSAARAESAAAEKA